jgi:hypothetical protein
VVRAVVRRSTVVPLLGDDRPRTLALPAGLGGGLVVLLVRGCGPGPFVVPRGRELHGGDGVEIASTNLVLELGVILALLMGWQFTAAEFAGGPVMIVVLAVFFRLFLCERPLNR